MKKLNVLFVILSLVLAVACGDKGGGSKSNSNNLPVYNQLQNPYQTPTPATQNGLFNPQNGVMEVGGQTFQPNQVAQQSQQYLQQLYYALQSNPYAYKPAYQANGIVKYNVRVTGYVTQTGNTQYPYVLVITSPLQAF